MDLGKERGFVFTLAILSPVLIIALQAFSGGAAGYITNKYAVNMLFKEYTPFHLGGVIKKNKEKFVAEVSDLVERDIINGKTLQEQGAKPGLEQQLRLILQDFLGDSAATVFGDKALGDLQGFAKTEAALGEFLQGELGKILPQLYDLAIAKPQLLALISDEQIAKIVDAVEAWLWQELNDQNKIEDFFAAFAKEKPNLCLDDFFSETTKAAFSENFSQIVLAQLAKGLEETGSAEAQAAKKQKLNQALLAICDSLDLAGIFQEFCKNLATKCPNQLLQPTEIASLAEVLVGDLAGYLQTEKGSLCLEKLLAIVVEILQKSDLTLWQLLGGVAENQENPSDTGKEAELAGFLQSLLPKVLPHLISWLQANRLELFAVLESALDQSLAELDGGVKSMILGLLRDFAMPDGESEANPVNNLVAYLENNLAGDKLARSVAAKLVAYLQQTKLREILTSSALAEWLQPENLASLLKDFVVTKQVAISREIAEAVATKPLGSLLNLADFDYGGFLQSQGVPWLGAIIWENRQSWFKAVAPILKKICNSQWDRLCSTNLVAFLQPSLAAKLKAKFLGCLGLVAEAGGGCGFGVKGELLSKNANAAKFDENNSENNRENNRENYRENQAKQRQEARAVLSFALKTVVAKLDLQCLLQAWKPQLLPVLQKKICHLAVAGGEVLQAWKIKDILGKMAGQQLFMAKSAKELHQLAVENLEPLLAGQIKKIVYENLIKQDEDQLCEIVQKFMGNQLKPLSVFGGILGGIVGLIYGLLQANSVLGYGFPATWSAGFLTCLLMAGVGVLTNVIALWMIFRPYKPNKIVAKIPFFKRFAQGYLPAHKGDFVKSVAQFVDTGLLNTEIINRVLQDHHDSLKCLLLQLLTRNNYGVFRDYALSHQDKLAFYAYEAGKNYLENPCLIARGAALISKLKIGDLLAANKIEAWLGNLKNWLKSDKASLKLGNLAWQFSSSQQVLGEILPKSAGGRGAAIVAEAVPKAAAYLRNNNLATTIFASKPQLAREMLEQNLAGILGDELTSKISLQIGAAVENYVLTNSKAVISKYFAVWLEQQLSGNLGQAFGGTLQREIEKHLPAICNFGTAKLSAYLQQQESAIGVIFKEAIKSRLNFFTRLGYEAMGGNQLVDATVAILVQQKMPEYLATHQGDLQLLGREILAAEFYEIPFAEIGLFDQLEVGCCLDGVYEKLRLDKDFGQLLRTGVADFATAELGEATAKFGVCLGLAEPAKLGIWLEELAKKFGNYLAASLLQNQEKLSLCLAVILENHLLKPVLTTPVQAFTRGISRKEFEETIGKVLSTLAESQVVFEDLVRDLTGLRAWELGDFLNCQLLAKDLTELMGDLVTGDACQAYLKEIVAALAADNCEILAESALADFSQGLVAALTLAITQNIAGVVQEIDFKQVTSEQIVAMDTAELDKLFHNFAGDFFMRLRCYGAVGFVFGINLYLPILISLLDLVYEKRSK